MYKGPAKVFKAVDVFFTYQPTLPRNPDSMPLHSTLADLMATRLPKQIFPLPTKHHNFLLPSLPLRLRATKNHRPNTAVCTTKRACLLSGHSLLLLHLDRLERYRDTLHNCVAVG